MTAPRKRPMRVNGQDYWPTQQQVLDLLARKRPPDLPPGSHWIEVRGKRWPLKYVVGEVLGLPGRAFSLPHAEVFARYVGLPFGRVEGTYVRPRSPRLAPNRGVQSP